jgi:hypothetical protein
VVPHVVKRTNVFARNGYEYALILEFIGSSSEKWTVHTWSKKPSDKSVEHVLGIVQRAIGVAYNALPSIRYSLSSAVVVRDDD